MEKVYPNQPPAINYSGIFISYRSRADEVCRHSMEAHSLVYLYSGRLSITSNGETYILHEGECAFIARDYKLEVTAFPEKGKNCVSVYLLFDRKFLVRYYQWLDKSKLAAFKRDFSRVSNLSPSRWITRRRLQEEHRLISEEGMKPSEIYSELGFKSLSHFSTAFRHQYGESPSELLNKYY